MVLLLLKKFNVLHCLHTSNLDSFGCEFYPTLEKNNFYSAQMLVKIKQKQIHLNSFHLSDISPIYLNHTRFSTHFLEFSIQTVLSWWQTLVQYDRLSFYNVSLARLCYIRSIYNINCIVFTGNYPWEIGFLKFHFQ